MKLYDVLREMQESPTPKIAVWKRDPAIGNIYITIVRPSATESHLVRMRGGSTTNIINEEEIMCDQWEWA